MRIPHISTILRSAPIAFGLAVLVVLALSIDREKAPSDVSSLRLDDATEVFDAWPAVRILPDPSARMDLDDAILRRDAFIEPETPKDNLGRRRMPIWLKIPIRNAGSERRWLLEIDHPTLNRIDGHVVSDGRIVDRFVMGSHIAGADRPVRARAHVAEMRLAPGSDHDLYLRIDTPSAMIVPIRIYHPSRYIETESWRMMVLGLMFGAAGLMLLMTLYSGRRLRDKAFALYAASLIGISLYFVSYTGLGHQFLW